MSREIQFESRFFRKKTVDNEWFIEHFALEKNNRAREKIYEIEIMIWTN